MTRDKAKDGRNWYVYCAGSPISKLDPDGQWEIFGFDFTVDGLKKGLITGLHGLASGITFGGYDGGGHQNDPGFGGSQLSGKVAGMALLAIDILEVTGVNVVFMRYPRSGGGGAALTVKGELSDWRLDVHKWKGAPPYKWPHYHRPPRPGMEGRPGEGKGRHRPWQGW